MSRQFFPHLSSAEASDVLIVLGMAGAAEPFMVGYDDAGALWVEVRDEDDALVSAALDGFVPTRSRGGEHPLPARWRDHLAHLRDFRDGVRAGTLTPTNAQRDHVIADVIDLLAHVLPRLDTDR